MNINAPVPQPSSMIAEAYSTARGAMYVGRIEEAFQTKPVSKVRGKVALILTSPPFPLLTKKSYGNSTGKEYLDWLQSLAPALTNLLADDGSVVIEVGNAWEPGIPEMSTLPLEALLAFKRAANLHLCQHIICHNPARLPSPAAWVNIERVRLKDSFTHVWWMAKTPRPKADNRHVLLPYGKDMQALLKSKKYNAGRRPSGHVVSETGFLTNHGGSISPNVLDLGENGRIPESVLQYSNTAWDSAYRQYCNENGLPAHPARMQSSLASFFIQFLTDKEDLVFDPFGGSNTTGATAEMMERRWLTIEADSAYAEGSKGRFPELISKRGV